MEKSKLIDESNGQFDLHVGESVKELFADGISSTLLGPVTTKIIFHSVVTPATDESPEQRRALFNINMSTAVLLEFAINLLRIAQSNSDGILHANTQQYKKLNSLINGIEAD